jgi:mannose-6-phosphate isomerase-like protein (cupin superfamily)
LSKHGLIDETLDLLAFRASDGSGAGTGSASGRVQGEYHWHKHDHEDECFIVLDGELVIDIEDKPSVTLGRHLGYTIPRGVVHRTRAAVKTVILMVEGAA